MESQNPTLADSADKMRNHPFMSLQNVLHCKLSGQEFSKPLEPSQIHLSRHSPKWRNSSRSRLLVTCLIKTTESNLTVKNQQSSETTPVSQLGSCRPQERNSLESDNREKGRLSQKSRSYSRPTTVKTRQAI